MAVITQMGHIESYDDYGVLQDFLAKQLSHGQLTIVLGAGFSFALGLPKWPALIEASFSLHSATRPVGLSDENAAENLFNVVLKKDRKKLLETIHFALYEKANLSFDIIQRNRTLSAIGAISMASLRGSVSEIVSFNFDDVLETYLTYYGFNAASFKTMPLMHQQTDIRVYHPHGLLPHKDLKEASNGIVLTQADYDDVVGVAKNPWRMKLIDIMQSRTCIFLGLSGADTNLTSILKEVNATHPAKSRGDCFWGVRFSDDDNDPYKSMWETRGVYQITLENYDKVHDFILTICQIAATKYRKRIIC